MKFNLKLFNKANGLPFDVQKINKNTVEFYYLDNIEQHEKYTNSGRFAIWAGKDDIFRVFIQKDYYNALKPFYKKEVNEIWIDFLHSASKKNKKTNLMFIVPLLIFYVFAALISSIFFQEQLMLFLLMMLSVVVVSNYFQNKKLRKDMQIMNNEAQIKIKNILGEKVFEELSVAQDKHYEDFFKSN